MSSSSMSQFWSTDLTRDALLSILDTATLKSLRLVSHGFAEVTSRHLFRDVRITFKSTTFTKPARMAALERIGSHIRDVTFVINHTPETFLPPLIEPVTGEEISFVFTPMVRCPSPPSSSMSTSVLVSTVTPVPASTSASSSPSNSPGSIRTGPKAARGRTAEPKYGTWEMTNLLIKQYPPLFHAAMNVSSFICALTHMPSLQHLRVSCAGQDPAHRYRRSVVDYALSSLRIAMEQAPLSRLEALSLTPIHPGGIQYLCPMAGIGSLPNSCKRWTRIHKIEIHMDGFPFDKGQATDHLKFLHSYLQCFSDLRNFVFKWIDTQGPSPLSLATEPTLCELASRSQACPKTRHYLRPLKFHKLQYLILANATVYASQVSDFLVEHRHSLIEFDFENVALRSGSWEEALLPWRTMSGAEYHGSWGEKQQAEVEVMEVPFVLGSDTGLEPHDDDNPISSSGEHKRRRRKKKKRHAKPKTAEIALNEELFASTAAMLLDEEPVRRTNLTFRSLREGFSNWARSKVKSKSPRMFWDMQSPHRLHKAVQSPILAN